MNDFNPNFDYYTYDADTRDMINKQNEIVAQLASKYLDANETAKAAKKAHEAALEGLCELITDREAARGKPVQGKFDFGQYTMPSAPRLAEPEPEDNQDKKPRFTVQRNDGSFEYEGDAEFGFLDNLAKVYVWTAMLNESTAEEIVEALNDPSHDDHQYWMDHIDSKVWDRYKRKPVAEIDTAVGEPIYIESTSTVNAWRDLPITVLDITDSVKKKLNDAGVSTLGQLEVDNLEGIKGLGKTAIVKIRAALAEKKDQLNGNQSQPGDGAEDSGNVNASEGAADPSSENAGQEAQQESEAE